LLPFQGGAKTVRFQTTQVNSDHIVSDVIVTEYTYDSDQYTSYWEGLLPIETFTSGHYTTALFITSLNGTEFGPRAMVSYSVNDNRNPPIRDCTEDWDCPVWDTVVCEDGFQTRTCTDPNNPPCLDTTTMPALTQECCLAEWYCEDWPDECPSTGVMTRVCIDGNQCDLANGSYTEDQECEYTESDNNTNANTESDNNTNANTEQQQSQIEEPTITMVAPTHGEVYKGSVGLQATLVGDVDGVLFFFDRINGRDNQLIGRAQPFENDPMTWERVWDISQIPNGDYYVYARAWRRDRHAGPFFISENRIRFTINNSAQTTEGTTDGTMISEDTRDTDGDGVTDTVEALIGGDPNAPDLTAEQASGLIDADITLTLEERQEQKDLLNRASFEEPITKGTLVPEKLKILKIDNFSPKIGQNQLVINGTGPVNTYLTLFIYSTPIVVTTKTDDSGNFTYTLDSDLLDGEHEVYVTLTDDTGKVKEKSNPLSFFIRRAQAVSEEEYLRGDLNVDADKSTTLNNYVIGVILLVGVLLIVVFIIYVLKKQK